MVPPIGGTGNGACNCRHGTPPANSPAAKAGGGGGAVPARQPPGRRLVRPERCPAKAGHGVRRRLVRCRLLAARFRPATEKRGTAGPDGALQGRWGVLPRPSGKRRTAMAGRIRPAFLGARSAAAVAARFGAAIAAWTGATFAACCPAAIAAGRLGGLGAGRVPARRAAGTGRRQCCGRDVRRGLGRGIRRATGFCGAGVWAAERPPAQPKRCQVVSPTGFPSWDRLSTTPQNRFDRFDSARTLSRHYRSGRRNRAGGQIECF